MPRPPARNGRHPLGTVLVVEDDPLIASFMVKALDIFGLGPRWVATAADALSAVEVGGVQLVLLDLGLPDVDGLDLLRRLRGRGCTVAVVVVTARSDPADLGEAERLGVDGFLLKPFAVPDLVGVVTTLLDRTTPGS